MRSKWLELGLATGIALFSTLIHAEGGGPAGPAFRVLTFSPAGLHAERGVSTSAIEIDGCTSRVELVDAPDRPRQLYCFVVSRDPEVSEINLGDVSWEEIPELFNVKAVAPPTRVSEINLGDVGWEEIPELFNVESVVLPNPLNDLELVDPDVNLTANAGYIEVRGSVDPWVAPPMVDLDGDGTLEMVISSCGGENTLYAFSILRESGPGAPSGWPVRFATGEGRSLTEAPLADVDGDDDFEIVVGAGELLSIWDSTGLWFETLVEWGTIRGELLAQRSL